MKSVAHLRPWSHSLSSGATALIIGFIAYLLVSWNGSSPTVLGHVFARRMTAGQFIFTGTVALLWYFCGTAFGLYEDRHDSWPARLGRLVECAGAVTSLLGLYLVLFQPKAKLGSVLGVFLACAVALEIAGILLRHLNATPHRVVIAGSERLAAKAWRAFRTRRSHQMELVGFVDEAYRADLLPDIAARYLGDISALPRIVLEYGIHDVVVAIPGGVQEADTERAITAAGVLGVRILCLKDICGIPPEHIARDYGDVFFELVPGPRLQGLAQGTKRVLDVLLAASALLVAAPLFLVALVWGWMISKPLHFQPETWIGVGRRPYRSYHLSARWMSFRIQFWVEHLAHWWNILIGEMSIVGPAPLSAEDLAKADPEVLAGRFNVRPGLTGLLNQQREHEIKRAGQDTVHSAPWSLTSDVKILAKTLRAVTERTAIAERSAGVL